MENSKNAEMCDIISKIDRNFICEIEMKLGDILWCSVIAMSALFICGKENVIVEANEISN